MQPALDRAVGVPAHGYRAKRCVAAQDDVFTSGATANVCAKALKRAGAAKVWLVCRAGATRNGGGQDWCAALTSETAIHSSEN
jgi:hypothetical protein